MNKKRIFVNRFLLAVMLVISIYLSLVGTNILPIDKGSASYIALIVSFIFLAGMLIIAPSLNKDSEKFILSFLLLTTVQMLIVLGIVGVIIVMKIENVQLIGFHFLAVFSVLLFLQSFLLIKINKLSA